MLRFEFWLTPMVVKIQESRAKSVGKLNRETCGIIVKKNIYTPNTVHDKLNQLHF